MTFISIKLSVCPCVCGQCYPQTPLPLHVLTFMPRECSLPTPSPETSPKRNFATFLSTTEEQRGILWDTKRIKTEGSTCMRISNSPNSVEYETIDTSTSRTSIQISKAFEIQSSVSRTVRKKEITSPTWKSREERERTAKSLRVRILRRNFLLQSRKPILATWCCTSTEYPPSPTISGQRQSQDTPANFLHL